MPSLNSFFKKKCRRSPPCLPAGKTGVREREKKLVLMFFTLKRYQGPVDC
jgi:hypothetical protein